jgi:predicted phosphodiesterase
VSREENDRDFLNIEVPSNTRIAVIGDVHEHPEQFQKMLKELKPTKMFRLVSVGDFYDKGFGIKTAEAMTQEMQSLQKREAGYAVRGNHELKHIRKNKKNPSEELVWWKRQPLTLSFQFKSGARVTVVHAGITPHHNWGDLKKDVEVCYVRDVDELGKMIPLVWKDIDGVRTLVKAKEGGEEWHKKYDGRFGYVCSGHAAQKDGEAKFYKFSCNLDSGIYESGILTAQIFDEEGNRGDVVRVEGTPKRPKLNIGY